MPRSFATFSLPLAVWRRVAKFALAVMLLADVGPTFAQGTSATGALQGTRPAATAPAATPAAAETGASGTSYVNPFPPGDIYKLQVYGDGFAEGLLQGMTEIMRPEERVELPRKHRALGALIRTEYEDDLKIEEQSRDVFHIGVVMQGLNDRGSLRSPGSSSIKFGTPAWKDQYSQRIDRLLKALKRRNMAVYVVAMPPLRRPEANSDLEFVNETLVERAFANGIRLIEVADSFNDENGAFSQFGPDSAGNREKLRDGDGVGFTSGGYRKLAGLVVTELKRDLAAARAERAVPLAGSESEQQRINPDKAGITVSPTLPRPVAGKDGREPRAPSGAVAAQAASASAVQLLRAGPSQGDQKAETTKVALKLPGISGRTDVTQVEIVRPAISAAVIALLTRKETVDAVQQPFELLADDVGDGVSVSTMVTALADSPATSGKRRGPTNQAAYTAVWIKGERLPPKPGRADDFTWPRPGSEPDAAAPVAARPAALSPAPAVATQPEPTGRANRSKSGR